MATQGYSNVGEEWAQKWCFRQDVTGIRDTSVEILLYNDTTDALSDSSDIGNITTEPNDGNYVRQTVTLDSADFSLSFPSADVRATTVTVTFDVTNTTGSVDAWGAVVSFQSDVVNSETGQNPHLIATGTFSSVDLSANDKVDVTAQFDLN